MHPSALRLVSHAHHDAPLAPANPLAPEALSESSRMARLFTFCLPKVADLFGKNLDSSATENENLTAERYNPIGFNDLIDSAIHSIGREGESKDTILDYLNNATFFVDLDDSRIFYSFNDGFMAKKLKLVDELRAKETGQHLLNPS